MSFAKVSCSVLLSSILLSTAEAITSSAVVRVCEPQEGCWNVFPHPSFSETSYRAYKDCLASGRKNPFCSFNWAEDLGYWVCITSSCPGFEQGWSRPYEVSSVLNMGKIRSEGHSIGYVRKRELIWGEKIKP